MTDLELRREVETELQWEPSVNSAGVGPLLGLVSLTLGLAIYLFVEAALEFTLSFILRPAPGWGWLLFDGIITLLLALLIWKTWPWSTEWAIGTLVGISMLFSGTSRLMLSLAARRPNNNGY